MISKLIVTCMGGMACMGHGYLERNTASSHRFTFNVFVFFEQGQRLFILPISLTVLYIKVILHIINCYRITSLGLVLHTCSPLLHYDVVLLIEVAMYFCRFIWMSLSITCFGLRTMRFART